MRIFKFNFGGFLFNYVMNVLTYVFFSLTLWMPSEMLLSEKDYCIYAASVGVTAELDRASGSGSSDDNGCSSRKRARKDGLGGGFFDLNLPAEFVDRN